MIYLLELPDGSKAPHIQFVLNANQNIEVYGIDFSQYGGMKLEAPGYMKLERLGKLKEQSTILRFQIINSLNNENWNFIKYPNPEIVLINKIE